MLHVVAASSNGGGSLGLLLPLLLVAAFFFLLVRPQRRRQRQMKEVQAAVLPGVEVVTTSGLFGTVLAVQDDVITLEVAPGVPMRFLRGAIGRVVSQAPSSDAPSGLPPEDRPPV